MDKIIKLLCDFITNNINSIIWTVKFDAAMHTILIVPSYLLSTPLDQLLCFIYVRFVLTCETESYFVPIENFDYV